MTVRRPVHCLVAEPQFGLRNLLDDLLSVSDVVVTAVASEADAMRALRAADSKISVVVCPAPPVGAKHSLVAKIRSAEPALAELPVLCLSPAKGLQDRAMAYTSGATEYLELPVSPTTLADRVHHWARRPHRPF